MGGDSRGEHRARRLWRDTPRTASRYFYAGAELRGLAKNRREESWLRVDDPLGKEYWAHHNSAANYAVANRHIIVRGVQTALENVFKATGEIFYVISHNLVQKEALVLPNGAAILYPLSGAFDTGCSVNHGSGRVMARGQAKRKLAEIHDDIDREMRYIKRMLGGVEIQGIVGNTRRTPLDECGHVYTDLDEVLRVLETEGVAHLAHRTYAVANIKGAD